jgi:hypothetical protein
MTARIQNAGLARITAALMALLVPANRLVFHWGNCIPEREH